MIVAYSFGQAYDVVNCVTERFAQLQRGGGLFSPFRTFGQTVFWHFSSMVAHNAMNKDNIHAEKKDVIFRAD